MQNINIERMTLEEAADVLAQHAKGEVHSDGTTRYALQASAVMVDIGAGVYFKVAAQ